MTAVKFACVLTSLQSTENPESNGMYLDPKQLVERWQGAITKGTLANWRAKKKGPPYVKMGEKVLYPIDKLVNWEESQLKNMSANDNNEIGGDDAAVGYRV